MEGWRRRWKWMEGGRDEVKRKEKQREGRRRKKSEVERDVVGGKCTVAGV